MNKNIRIIIAIIVTVFLILLWIIYLSNRNNIININNNRKCSINNSAVSDMRPPDKAKYFYDRAQVAIYRKDYEGAIKCLEIEREVFPAETRYVYYKIGYVYVLMGEYEKAIDYLNLSLSKSTPGHDSLYNEKCYYRGLAYYNLGKYEEAKNDFEKTISVKYIYYNVEKKDNVELKDNNTRRKIKKEAYKYLYEIESRAGNQKKAQEYLNILNTNK